METKFYITRDTETGTFIDRFDTMEDAQNAIARYENEDRELESYTEDFYEIKEFDLSEKDGYVAISDNSTCAQFYLFEGQEIGHDTIIEELILAVSLCGFNSQNLISLINSCKIDATVEIYQL